MSFTSGLRNTRIAKADGMVGDQWAIYFREQDEQIAASPAVVSSPIALTSQHATIPTTSIPSDTLAPGLYSLSYYAQIVTPAGVSSDLTITLAWTTNGVTQTYVGALLNGNTTATHQAGGPPLIRVDRATPVTYAVVYNSNPAAVMQYSLDIVLQAVSL